MSTPGVKLTARFGNASVYMVLYGEVTSERFRKAKVELEHRASMLDTTRPYPRIRIDPEDRDHF